MRQILLLSAESFPRMNFMVNNTWKKLARAVLCFAFWLLVWQIFSMVLARPTVLPTPFAVLQKLGELMGTKAFYMDCLYSLLRIFAGLMLGILSGVLIASLCAAFGLFDGIFSPAVSVIKATPIASIIILMLFILEKSYVPMVAAMLMSVPIVFSNVRKGISSVPAEQKEVADVYNFGFGKRLKYCIIPSVLPYFSAACRSSLGLAWKAGIAAEVICTPKYSIGLNLNDAKIYLESEALYAWTIVVVIMSVLIEKGVIFILDRLVRKGGLANVKTLED
ncbi:MAG: ABC transporter permease subunit [Ruminococcaceae bacterium]|nr:ABC transporter permease subunit [Oscillospiraceae bacterium]